MPDFRVADNAPEHPKLRAVGLAAAGLWSLAGAYAMRELTDGWVPDYWVQTWPGGKKQAAALIQVGLWSAVPRQGIAGYLFHDWAEYQRSAASVNEDRRKGRERAKRSRERHAERAPEPLGNGTDLLSSNNGVFVRETAAESTERDTAPERSTTRRPAETVGRSGEPGANVRLESHDSRALTRALSSSSVGRGTSGKQREDSRNGPPPRCADHADMPRGQRPPPCGACKELRLEAQRDADDAAERDAADRAARRAAVDACPLCDDRGMRETAGGALARCTHRTPLEVVS